MMVGIAEKLSGEKLVEEFDRNGAVCVRDAFDEEWIEMLRRGFARVQADPSPRAHEFVRTSDQKVFRSDPDNWERIPEYREFVYHSPCSELAARLMKSERANLFFDQSFYRSPGQQFRTPWHQDEPYWSIEGFQTMGIWMPLVPVEKKSSLEFVSGSHKWRQKYRQIDFDDVSPEALQNGKANLDGDGWEPLPDFDADPARWEIIAWEMEPGDCAIFNGRTYHGGSGRLAAERDLSVYNTKWAGDDVRAAFRPWKMQPDHTGKMLAGGMRHGDRLDPKLFPQLWPRAAT
jgi:ectoine hydroxylase-related dioxygenase (phytanoyl-CoA dioxygenase family)